MKRQTTLKEYWTWSEEEDAGDNPELELSNNDEVANEPVKYDQDFKNLYWSRVVSVQQFRTDENERWQLLQDLNDERE